MTYLYELLKQLISSLLLSVDNVVQNFGISIIIATILIRIILLPLTLKQDKSMKAMKKIQPELETLKEKYGNDKQLLNQKTIELYQKHKVDRKSTRLNSSHANISYAVFCLKKKK